MPTPPNAEQARQRTTVFVCLMCGKRSRDENGDHAIDGGWDESCMLNAVRAYEDSLVFSQGRVASIDDGGVVGAIPDRQARIDELSADIERKIANFSNPDTSDLDPELLKYAEEAADRLRASRTPQPGQEG